MSRIPIAVAVFLLGLFPGLGTLSAQASGPGPTALKEGIEIPRHVEPRDDPVYSEVFQIRVPKGRRGLILAEQRGADVTIEARNPALSEPWRVDSPLDFDGTEILLLPPAVVGTVELQIQARLPAGPSAEPALREQHPSRFVLKFETVPQSNAHRHRLELLGNLTAAGRSWAKGDGDGRNRALDFYGRAANVAASNEDKSSHPPERPVGAVDGFQPLRIQAAYAQAVLLRLLGRHEEAHQRSKTLLEAWESLGDTRRLADTWNEIGLVSGPAGRTDEARQAFGRAIELAEQLDDPFRLAYLRGNLCLVDLMDNQLRRGVDCYAAALPTVRKVGDFETESAYLLNMAQAQRRLGHLDEARKLYGRALEIQTNAGLKKLEAKTLNNLAGLHLDRGDLEAALDAFHHAAARFDQLGDLRWHGRSLHNLASTYSTLGDEASARGYLEKALEAHRRIGYLNGEANALRIFGHLEARQGNLAAARRAYTSSRDLEHRTRDEVGEAVANAYIARVQIENGKYEQARARLQASLEVLRQADWNAKSARVLLDLGRCLTQLGRTDDARTTLSEALEVFRELRDPLGKGVALFYLAELVESLDSTSSHADPGSETEVIELLQRAAAAFDTVTLNLKDPDRRSFFASSQRKARERYASRLIEAGQWAEALQASEAARAWGLRTVLATSGGLIRSEQGRQRSSLVELDAPDLAQIRAQLDDYTLLLQYLVGEHSSHLFVVGRTRFEVHGLPGRDILEEAVRKARIHLASGSFDITDMSALSELLLAPAWKVIDQPEISNLALALDGPLHYLPFAALPLPGGDPSTTTALTPPLVSRFELARIPSVAVLGLERRRRAQRAPAEGFAAVLADPIFTAHDLRLPRPPALALGPDRDTELFRLRWSQREAEAVAQAAGGKPTLVALGSDAHRDLLLGEPLDRYQIVHLATHARVDATVASRSGLELSAFDADGSPRQGFVSLPALRRLELQADLVVLSACRTALGPKIRGEGLVGLVQTFLEAGAARVIASLWPVPDRSTAELMEYFYAALAQDVPPAAALRQAQLNILAEHPDRPPSAWAGFVLVGDWR